MGVIGDAVLLADVFPNATVGHAAEDAVGKKERWVIGVIARDGGKDRDDHGLGDALAIDINDAVVSGGGGMGGREGAVPVQPPNTAVESATASLNVMSPAKIRAAMLGFQKRS